MLFKNGRVLALPFCFNTTIKVIYLLMQAKIILQGMLCLEIFGLYAMIKTDATVEISARAALPKIPNAVFCSVRQEIPSGYITRV